MALPLPPAVVLLAGLCAPRTAVTAAGEELGPTLARAVLEHAAALGDGDVRYVPVRIGWMRTRSMELFRYLNRDLFPDASESEAPQQPARSPIDTLAATNDRLAERGIEFLVMIYPTRLNVYPEALCDVEVGDDFAGYAPGSSACSHSRETEAWTCSTCCPCWLASGATPRGRPTIRSS